MAVRLPRTAGLARSGLQKAWPPQRRPFLHLTAAALGQARDDGHTLATTRTLPYAGDDLFGIISDVDAYDAFLPHCTLSRVTHWRGPGSGPGSGPGPGSPESGPRWPARADLTVGWGPVSQTYSSRVYCVPGHRVVEAVSGRRGRPTLTAAERAEIGLGTVDDAEEAKRDAAETARLRAGLADEHDPFESLVTRWTVAPTAGPTTSSPWSRVELRIRFLFRNPLYQVAVAQLGSEMATKMIEAFEDRACALLGPRHGRL